MAEILFFEIEDEDTVVVESTTDGTILVLGNAIATAYAVGSGATEGTIIVRGDAVLDAYVDVVAPEVPAITDGTIYAYSEITMYEVTGSEVDGTIYVFGEAAEDFGTDGTIIVTGDANEHFAPTDDYVFITEPYGIVQSFVGAYYEDMADAVEFGVTVQASDHAFLRDALRVLGSPLHVLTSHEVLSASIEFDDVLRAIYHELVTLSLELGVTDVVDYRAMALMVDRLLVSGVVTTALQAQTLVSSSIVFGDRVFSAWRSIMEDLVEFQAGQSSTFTAINEMVDEALFGAVDESSVTLHVLVPDTVEFDAEVTTLAQLASTLRDSLSLVLRMQVDNGEYTAWTVNTATAGHTRYSNYPFNGYMQVGSKYYGTSDLGLYVLEGNSDDGEAIASKIRAGMSKLNNGNMKSIQSMYLGYKADGDLLVKVTVADDHNGKRESHVYTLVERGGGSQREARVPVGKGLQSVYWDYEIHNAEGANFELDSVEILPLIHERRIRGSSGGKA